MNQLLPNSQADRMETFLSGAFPRIQRITIALSLAGMIGATVLVSWKSGLGFAAGSVLAYLNFIWLHHSSQMMVQQAIASPENRPSKLRSVLTFAGRYVFVIIFAYVILKGYPQVRIAIMVGLVSPIIATMGEGIYEAVVISKTDETSD